MSTGESDGGFTSRQGSRDTEASVEFTNKRKTEADAAITAANKRVAAERAQESETVRTLVARMGTLEENYAAQGGVLDQVLAS